MKSNSKNIVSLKDVLSYENENVVYSFVDKFDISYQEANSIFNETKRWLWACYYRRKDILYSNTPMIIDDSILIIDEMWHTFILFTRPYHDFCHEYFTEFISHHPTIHREKQLLEEALKKNRDEVLKKEIVKRERQLSYIYDVLGEKTVKKWYIEYKRKYTPEVILAMRKK